MRCEWRVRFRTVLIVTCFVLGGWLTVPPASQAQAPLSQEGQWVGQVLDAESNRPLQGAVVRLLMSRKTALSDHRGRFSLPYPVEWPDTLEVRLLGYRPTRHPIQTRTSVEEGLLLRIAPEAIQLEGVTISATREERPANENPVSVGRIDGATIARINPAHPSRIANRIPGVWINATEGEGHMTSIRQPLSLLPQYLFLENGIPTRSTGFFNHNALFEVNIPQASSMEIIKGPGTALYGSDAIGGVINVETGRIPNESGMSISGEVGSFGFRRGLASASHVGEKDAFRLDVNWTDSDGWRRGTAYNRQSTTLAWRRMTGAASRIHTVATFTRVEQHPAGIAAISTEDYQIDPRIHYTPISYRDVTALRLSSAWNRWSGNSLISITPFFRYSAMELLPNWALTFDPAIWETENWSIGTQARWHWTDPDAVWKTIVGLEVDLSPGQRIETGISAERVGSVFVNYQPGAAQYDYDVTFMQGAPFVHAERRVSERLRATAGLRLDLAAYDYDNHLGPLESGSHQRPPSQRVSYSQLSPKAGLTYRLASGLTAVASYRHAFRVPSERQVFRQGAARTSIELKPVSADNVETGLRWQQGRHAAIEVTAYRLSKADDIVTFNYEDGSRGSVNTGRTRHLGVETGMRISPHDGLSASLAWTFAKHSYEAWITELDQDFSGNEMELAPRHLVHAELAWSPSFLNEAEIALNWHRVGSYWMNPDNTVRYDGHSLIHLRGRVALSQVWAITGRVGNVRDTLYAQRALSNAFRGDEWAPGIPRSVNLAVQASF